MIHYICRNPLTEVSFEAIYAHIYQFTKVACKPFACFRVSKVNERHTRLPQIHLPYVAISLFHKVTLLFTFFKQS
ncbi:hypothetical protein D3C78_833120 [compost metagenome]